MTAPKSLREPRAVSLDAPARPRDAAWVTRWSGSAWVEVLPELFANSTETVAEPSLTFDRHGEPVVVWDEFDGPGYRVEVWTREGCL